MTCQRVWQEPGDVCGYVRLYLPVLLFLLFSELIRVCKGVAPEPVGLGLYEGGALTPPRPLNSLHCYLPHLPR